MLASGCLAIAQKEQPTEAVLPGKTYRERTMDQQHARQRDTDSEKPASFAERFGDPQDKDSWKTVTEKAAAEVSETKLAALPSLTLSNTKLPKAELNPDEKSVVVVDKAAKQTHVLQMHNGNLVEIVNVRDAVGKPSTPTPEGRFNILNKELNPTWYPPPSIGGRPVGPGPHNPLGVAKIRTDGAGGRILLHGTIRPDQIGSDASHGCIRHHNQDIMKIYPTVQKGDAVYIVKKFAGTKLRAEDFGRR